MASGIGVSEDRATYTVGAMTDAAKDVNRRLKKCHYQASETQFLRQLEDLTFSRAGLHVMWGHAEAGSWCWFDLREWVKELEMAKSRICHIRSRLVADGVIWYEALTERPGVGRIGWNLDFTQWQPLQTDYGTWGGARRGAGRPRKATQHADIDNLNTEQASIINLNAAEQAGVDDLNTSDEQTSVAILNCSAQASIDDLNKKYSSVQRSDASDVFKCATLVSSEAGREAARDDPVRILDTEEDPEGNANAFLVRAAQRAAASPDEQRGVASSSAPSPLSTSPTSKPRKRSAPKVYAPESIEVKFARYLAKRILAHSPNNREAKRAVAEEAKLQQWARPIDLMIREDGRKPEDIKAVIDFATTDDFWQSNILSPGKLREKYDQLDAKMRRRANSPPARAAPQRAAERVFRPASEFRLWGNESPSETGEE